MKNCFVVNEKPLLTFPYHRSLVVYWYIAEQYKFQGIPFHSRNLISLLNTGN